MPLKIQKKAAKYCDLWFKVIEFVLLAKKYYDIGGERIGAWVMVFSFFDTKKWLQYNNCDHGLILYFKREKCYSFYDK